MIRNTWKNIKMVHKEEKKKKRNIFFPRLLPPNFLLQGEKRRSLSALWNRCSLFHLNSPLPILPRPVKLSMLLQLRTGHGELIFFKEIKKRSSSSSNSRFSWTGCISPMPLGNSKQNPRVALLTDCCAWAVWTRLGKLFFGDTGQFEGLGKAGSFLPQWSTDPSKLGAWKAKACRLAVSV